MKSINTLVHQKIKEGFEMKAKLMGLLKDETGQAMTEYGLIIALIAIVVIVGLTAMSGQLNTLFTSISAALTPAP
jgi:pilus assembly protein Flp/PilA